MSTILSSKINRLLSYNPSGIVLLSSWLNEQGYSLDLQKRYRKSGWLKSIGHGAMIRTGDKVAYEGALYALQTQREMSTHIAGKSALSLLGKSHYLEVAQKKVILFGDLDESLPKWFVNHSWGVDIDYYQSSFLPPDLGLTTLDLNTFAVNISGAARALMECLYLAPQKQELLECYQLMENLNNLRPLEVQKLLGACKSVKVNRLFLYMAEKAKHEWLEYLDLDEVNLGKGKRSIVSNGIYIPEYQMTVPKQLEEYDDQPVL